MLPTEIKKYQLYWVYLHHRAQFTDKISQLLKKEDINVKKPLISLNPILDNGLLQVGKRFT